MQTKYCFRGERAHTSTLNHELAVVGIDCEKNRSKSLADVEFFAEEPFISHTTNR